MNQGRQRLTADHLMWGVALAIVLMHGYLATTSTNSLLNWYRYDDAFYYFKTAQNFAHGLGMTFDGTGTTNGFHPLWMAVCVPVFALARGIGDVLPLRVLVVIVGVLVAASAWALYRAGKRLWGAEVALLVAAFWALWPASYVALSAGGMETSLNALTLIVFWRMLMQVWARPTDGRAVRVLGWAAALAMLARLDNALIVAVVGLALIWRWWQEGLRGKRLVRIMWWFGWPGLLGVGAFLVWGYVAVGSWMPISSEVKAWWGSLMGTPYGRAWRYRLANFLTTWAHTPLAQWPRLWAQYLPSWRLAVALTAAFAALLGGIAGLRAAFRRWPDLKTHFSQAALAPFLGGVMAHWAYMRVFSGIMPLRPWYWTPERLAAAILAGWALSKLSQRIPASQRVKTAYLGTGMLLIILGGWWLEAFPWYNAHEHVYLHTARWVEAHTEKGAVIGAPGSGALGYFVHDRRVINLDGLISTPAYLHAWQEGKIVPYLHHLHVQYVFAGYWVKHMAPYKDTLAPYLVNLEQYRYDDVLAGLFRVQY